MIPRELDKAIPPPDMQPRNYFSRGDVRKMNARSRAYGSTPEMHKFKVHLPSSACPLLTACGRNSEKSDVVETEEQFLRAEPGKRCRTCVKRLEEKESRL